MVDVHIHKVFEGIATDSPRSIAVVSERGVLTYKQLRRLVLILSVRASDEDQGRAHLQVWPEELGKNLHVGENAISLDLW
jgi:hypothetical protein